MAVKLDKIDKKILCLLSQNARLGFADIARMIESNVPTVWNRVNKLVENGVIVKFSMMIYRGAVGIKRQNEVLIKIININTEQKANLVKIFKKHPRIIRVIEFQGPWHFSLTICGETIIDIKKIVDTIRKSLQEFNYEFTLLPTYHDQAIRPLFFLENEKFDLPKEDKIKGAYMPKILESRKAIPKYVEKLDDKDLEIINKLRDDSRMSLQDLGKSIGLDAKSVNYRLLKMMRRNIIRGFAPIIDYEILGYSCFWLRLHINVDEKKLEEFRQHIKSIPEAYHYLEFLDMWNVGVIFLVKDQTKIDSIVDTAIKEYQGLIRNYEIIIQKKQHKYEFIPDDILEIYHQQISKDIY